MHSLQMPELPVFDGAGFAHIVLENPSTEVSWQEV